MCACKYILYIMTKSKGFILYKDKHWLSVCSSSTMLHTLQTKQLVKHDIVPINNFTQIADIVFVLLFSRSFYHAVL